MGCILERLQQEEPESAAIIVDRVSVESTSLQGNLKAGAALRKSIETYGFAILKGLLNSAEVAEWRSLCLEQVCMKKPLLEVGYFLSDLSSRSEFSKPMAILTEHPHVVAAVQALVGPTGFRFCGHSDIGADRIVFWHKDKLNGPYSKYQKLDPWKLAPDGSTHEIYKLLIYLQDHSLDENGLRVIPGSHVEPHVQLAGRRFVQLHTCLGDAILIDQRVSHTGQSKARPPPHRILLSLGFGANNIFTDEFEQGTLARQADDQIDLEKRAALSPWRRAVDNFWHEACLWPLLSLLYNRVDPTLIQTVAKYAYG